ncbi:MAG: hypothetical protein IT251_07915 [Chitinophagaceae bacterium]|nr:hypothetical protein [Chitinophagaceae bacterium]
MKYLSICLFILSNIFFTHVFAQNSTSNFKKLNIINTTNDSGFLTIGSININGNKRTKDYIILREVPFKLGNKYKPHELTGLLELARNQIMNTALFVDAQVYVTNLLKDTAFINIDVKERWYIFPIPYFNLVDRNFNQWINEHNASLDRVNYGIKFFHFNVSGRNDKLSLDVIGGYSQQLQFNYTNPFADKTLKHGFSVGFGYVRQKELNYASLNNKQVFVRTNSFVRDGFRSLLTYSYRPDSKYRFYVSLGLNMDKISDTVLKLNPTYFPYYTNKITYPTLLVMLQYFGVDYIPFPKKGFLYQVSIFNRSFNKKANLFQLSVKTTNVLPLATNSFLNIHTNSILKIGDNRSYFNQSLMGYNEVFLRGLESYVIDGMAGVVANNSLYQKLFKFVFKNPIKIKGHENIPFHFYAKLFSDFGYAYNKYAAVNNPLANKFLYTAGAGIDITTIYDFVFRIEYGLNQLGNTAFGLRVKGEF